MIKKLFMLACMATCLCCVADAQTKLGLRAGFNLPNIMMRPAQGPRTETITGFQIGLKADMPLINDFYLQPVIMFNRRGFQQNGNWFSGEGNRIQVKADYIDVPVHFLYKPQIGRGNLLVGAGPYVAYGTEGKWNTDKDPRMDDIIIENKGKVIFRDSFMDGEFTSYLYGRPWDYGASFLLGYEFSQRFSVQLNVQPGIANLAPRYSTPGSKMKNKSMGISAGINF